MGTFSYEARILACQQCGAPIEVPTAGGAATCGSCGTVREAAPRPPPPTAAPAPRLRDQERLARLRSQDGKPMLPPPGLQSLFAGGRIPPHKLGEAQAIWQASITSMHSAADYEAAERVLFLTMVLSQHYFDQGDRRRQRALIESAAETFPLPRHRQFMYGYLTRNAVSEGDLRAAEQWLAYLDPTSDDLQMDSAYRVSRALLETARRDWTAVLELLGSNQTDVPILDAMDAMATALRANALEQQGDLAGAEAVLEAYMGEGGASGRATLAGVVKAYNRLGLCPQTLGAAQERYSEKASKVAAARAGGGIGGLFFFLGGGMILGGIIAPILHLAGVADSGPAAFLLIPGFILFFIGRGLHRAAKRAAYLRAHGVRTTGEVVSVGRTGTKINNVPQYKVTLRITLEGKDPYEASTKILVPDHAAAQLTPGVQLAVRVDPDNPQAMIIEGD